MFDPLKIIRQSTEQPLSTVSIQAPEGEWLGEVNSVDKPEDIAKWMRENKSKNPGGGTFVVLSVPIVILSPEARSKVNVKEDRKLISYYNCFLTFNTQGNLSTADGDNVALGQLFNACGINAAGASIEMLPGKGSFTAIVKQSPRDREDPESDKIAKVTRVAPRR